MLKSTIHAKASNRSIDSVYTPQYDYNQFLLFQKPKEDQTVKKSQVQHQSMPFNRILKSRNVTKIANKKGSNVETNGIVTLPLSKPTQIDQVHVKSKSISYGRF